MLGLDWMHDPTYRLSLGVLNRGWNVTVSEWTNTLIRRVCVCWTQLCYFITKTFPLLSSSDFSPWKLHIHLKMNHKQNES